MCTKFNTDIRVANIVSCDKYFCDVLERVVSVGVKFCHCPLTGPVTVSTGLALSHSP